MNNNNNDVNINVCYNYYEKQTNIMYIELTLHKINTHRDTQTKKTNDE